MFRSFRVQAEVKTGANDPSLSRKKPRNTRGFFRVRPVPGRTP